MDKHLRHRVKERLDQIQDTLPPHPIDRSTGIPGPYHSRRFQQIDELLKISRSLLQQR